MAEAFDDPRFPPITEKELKDLNIEISVLTPFKQINDVNEIEVGKHGLFIEKGFFSGLLLPQVATEYGWDREIFLEQTCRKAGLPPHAWKEKDTKDLHLLSGYLLKDKGSAQITGLQPCCQRFMELVTPDASGTLQS